MQGLESWTAMDGDTDWIAFSKKSAANIPIVLPREELIEQRFAIVNDTACGGVKSDTLDK
jgi:hypothetical protein